MTHPPAIKCTWSGRPLEDLTRLIGMRVKLVGHSTEDAVCATAVTALKSIRAATRVAKYQSVKTKDVQVRDVTADFTPGFAHRRRVLRIGGAHGSYLSGTPKNLRGGLGKVRNLMGRYTPKEKPRAFWAKYAPPWAIGKEGFTNQVRIGYFVARNQKQVKEWMVKHVRIRVKQSSKLAKNAISVAIAKIASQNAQMEGTSYAREVADRFAVVKVRKNKDYYGVKFFDGLGYSLAAVKGGKNGVDLALKKAANLMAGRLAHYLNRMFQSAGNIQSPYPEIRRPL